MFAQFYPANSWKKVRAELSELMGMAGRVRDRDIVQALLGELGIAPDSAAGQRVAAERREAERHLLSEIRRWKRRDFSRKWRARLEL